LKILRDNFSIIPDLPGTEIVLNVRDFLDNFLNFFNPHIINSPVVIVEEIRWFGGRIFLIKKNRMKQIRT